MNQIATVLKQSVDDNGKTIVSWNENPMLNTLVYECELSDGTVREYAAKIIEENIFLKADPDGHRDRMMTGITDHKRDGTAVPKSQKYMKTRSVQK